MLEIGQVIAGKYKVLHQVGKGGMSYVYLVITEDLNREWAIKEVPKVRKLRPDEGGDGEETIEQTVREDMTNESQIMARLRNTHLPQINEIIETDDSYLIVMDYIEGKTLKQELIDNGPKTVEETVDIALQMCDALQYLHTLTPPIIYRDMKPGNIMHRPDGTCVLIDFGISREFKDDGKDQDTRCLGTKGFAPPEQYGGGLGQTDVRSDIYALGATMYSLVTGKDPSKPPYEMRPIRKWNPALSSGLEEIIIKCTQNDPEKRYQDVDQLAQALRHYRELEKEYQKEKNAQVRLCTAFLIMGLFFFLGGIWANIHAGSMKDGTYKGLIRAAETAVTKEERIAKYKEAVAQAPGKGEAYQGILSEYLSDDNLTQEEAEEMAQVLGYKGESDKENAESIFQKKNPRAYDEFCYNYGLAFFYYYGKDGNKPLSEPWFRKAKESRYLEKRKCERAGRFHSISGYHVRLSRHDKAGDTAVSYEDYWKDLVALSSGNIAEEDNVKTALVVYEDLAYQIAVHAQDFKNAGIGYEDMASELDMVLGKISVIQEGEDDQIGRLKTSVTENAKKAKETLEAVFQEMEE